MRARLAEGPGPKARKQLANLLQHAVRGIAANPTATLEDLLVFVHGTLQHGLAQEARSVELSQAAASLEDPDDEQSEPCRPFPHSLLLLHESCTSARMILQDSKSSGFAGPWISSQGLTGWAKSQSLLYPALGCLYDFFCHPADWLAAALPVSGPWDV